MQWANDERNRQKAKALAARSEDFDEVLDPVGVFARKQTLSAQGAQRQDARADARLAMIEYVENQTNPTISTACPELKHTGLRGCSLKIDVDMPQRVFKFSIHFFCKPNFLCKPKNCITISP